MREQLDFVMASHWLTSRWKGSLLQQIVTETNFEHWKYLKLFLKLQGSFIC